jgi:chromate transport protein ChrA
MVEEELVSGDGWISDDSSFYGMFFARFVPGSASDQWR